MQEKRRGKLGEIEYLNVNYFRRVELSGEITA